MIGTVQIELCKEDRVRLDNIQSALTALVSLAMESPSKETAKVYEEMGRGLAESVALAAVEPAPATEPEKPKATLADIQSLVQKLASISSTAREEVKRIVNTYSARVSEIPADKYDEIMTKLSELDGSVAK